MCKYIKKYKYIYRNTNVHIFKWIIFGRSILEIKITIIQYIQIYTNID